MAAMESISELPQPILHHILSFLSQKEAVQTCVLSKSWRHLGITRPKIEFRENMFPQNKRKFMSVLDKTLQRYRDHNLSIQEFVMEFFPREENLALENWILLVLFHMGVKIFSFNFGFEPSYNSVRSVIFQAQSIEELYLERCYLSNSCIGKILLKHLRTLSLKTVRITDEALNMIISSCPLIEHMVLNMCSELKTIKVGEVHNLKRFECYCIPNLAATTVIEFNSQTLETIHISYYPFFFQHHNEYFPRLKSLCLQNVRLPTKKSFDDKTFPRKNFPCLQVLELVSCTVGDDGLLEEFRLSSPSIKRLIIQNCTNSTKSAIKIDAENLLYFEFSGNTPPSPFSLKTTSNEWKSHIDLSCQLYSKKDAFSTWFLKLYQLLKALTKSHISLSLDCFFHRMRHITFRGSYKPVEVERLIANQSFLSSIDYPESLNILFHTFRPRYITGMYLYVDAKYDCQLRENNTQVDSLCKFFLEEIRGETTLSHRCFWIHDLKEVSMETFDENANKWRLVQGTSLSECALMPNKQQSKQEFRIRLKWRES